MPMITEIRRKLPLFPRRDAASNESGQVHHIPIEDIIPNRNQPRTAFHTGAIARLSESIQRYGVLQPLTVRKVLLPVAEDEPTRPRTVIYELVAGERRLRAAKLAGLESVPCLIINTDDATSAELAIIENLLRENLNMFEQAEAFARLIREFHLTQEEAARRVSMSQSAVANKLRILRLSREERERILAAGLTERHARALLKLSDAALRADVLECIIERKMNVSATEAYIDRTLTEMARFQAKSAQNAPKSREIGSNDAQSTPFASHLPSTDAVSCAFATSEDTRETDAAAEECALPEAIRDVVAQRRGRSKGCIKDIQLFYNSVRNAVSILEGVGISGEIVRQENEREIRVTVTLTKPTAE